MKRLEHRGDAADWWLVDYWYLKLWYFSRYRIKKSLLFIVCFSTSRVERRLTSLQSCHLTVTQYEEERVWSEEGEHLHRERKGGGGGGGGRSESWWWYMVEEAEECDWLPYCFLISVCVSVSVWLWTQAVPVLSSGGSATTDAYFSRWRFAAEIWICMKWISHLLHC